MLGFSTGASCFLHPFLFDVLSNVPLLVVVLRVSLGLLSSNLLVDLCQRLCTLAVEQLPYRAGLGALLYWGFVLSCVPLPAVYWLSRHCFSLAVPGRMLPLPVDLALELSLCRTVVGALLFWGPALLAYLSPSSVKSLVGLMPPSFCGLTVPVPP